MNAFGDSAVQTRRFGVRGAVHDYSGVVVLRGVDFEMRSGEVHALLGENGCGKSTLIKVMTGAVQPTSGELYLDDKPTGFSSPARAQASGIGVVHQNYNLFPDLSVEKNVIGTNSRVPRNRWLLGSVDHRQLRQTVTRLFEGLAIEIDPAAMLRDLGPAERKFVEIARAMTLAPRFLILDEPTASLEPGSAKRVLSLLETLRQQGVGLAFVSHRLDEVLAISDRYTVLRDGQRVAHGENVGLDESSLAEMMIGNRAQPSTRRSATSTGDVRLALRQVQVLPGAAPLNLEVRRGEILGLTGLVGSGAAELVKMLGGAEPLRGSVEIDGRAVAIRQPRDAQRLGIGYIPEDRKAVGLVLDQSAALNISLASLGQVSRAGVMSFGRVAERAEDFRKRMSIRLASVHAPVSSLSGGNQQKVMIAKWLASGVQIIAVEEPTQGVDIGGKAQIHDLLRDFAAAGGTVVMASTDVREVAAVSSRVGIFRHGNLQELLDADQLDEARITARGASDAEHYLAALVDVESA
jgi:ABC-type sugar transport system ATPase subunit